MTGRFGKIVSKLNDAPVNLQTDKPVNLQEVATLEGETVPSVSTKESALETIESKQVNPQTGKPASIEEPVEPVVQLEKYSTYLESDLIMQLKIFAVSSKLKDYQVVNLALRAYLEGQTKG